MERPFEEADVAQGFRQAGRLGVALQAAAPLGEEDHGDVRPGWLIGQSAGERAQIGAADRLDRGDHEAGLVGQAFDQARDIRLDSAGYAGLRQQGAGDGRVASMGRKDEGEKSVVSCRHLQRPSLSPEPPIPQRLERLEARLETPSGARPATGRRLQGETPEWCLRARWSAS